jgi:hypothetical protein
VYSGRNWAKVEVNGADIFGRRLELVTPLGAASEAQQATRDAAVIYGRSVGVDVVIIPM